MNPAVREALQAGRLGYGFSAGGFLYPYHLGVLWELKEMGVLRDKALLAGASAGSLAVAVYNCGIDVPDATAHLLDFAKEMRRDGTRFRLDATLRGFLRSYLPADAHQRCSGSTAIAVTRVLPYLQPELVTDFHSKVMRLIVLGC